ncbi:hypothetical protein GPL21_00325 [Bradyrhizobium pachyrhizi]|uniref:Uncharacterized protein n=1 Tax=Bradyrhizobium pachyrhizi TaxID=280333 RepID=A0A844SHK6_9BRAD|nr:hypothetical protein [Bradyrhizobium pachyrhizi]MVT63559.1 hypothetical protein [Bradyrhizobium pachyrhizi]
MNMHPRFETARESTVRELTISKILADLVRTLQLIEAEIAAEEERARIFDRSNVRYPVLAKSLNDRRDNLRVTIAALEQRLTERDSAPHSVADKDETQRHIVGVFRAL